jgi:hypothetical protein
MMRNQLKLNVDMNILHTGKIDYSLKNWIVQFTCIPQCIKNTRWC